MTDALIEAVARAINRDIPGDLNSVPLYQIARAALKAIEDSGTHLVVPAWKPINTAPKDRLILVYAPGGHPDYYEPLSPLISVCQWHEDAGFCIDELRQPTHWMPPPSPPDRENNP